MLKIDNKPRTKSVSYLSNNNNNNNNNLRLIMVQTNRLHTVYNIQSATQGSNDTQTVTQDSSNNQV